MSRQMESAQYCAPPCGQAPQQRPRSPRLRHGPVPSRSPALQPQIRLQAAPTRVQEGKQGRAAGKNEAEEGAGPQSPPREPGRACCEQIVAPAAPPPAPQAIEAGNMDGARIYASVRGWAAQKLPWSSPPRRCSRHLPCAPPATARTRSARRTRPSTFSASPLALTGCAQRAQPAVVACSPHAGTLPPRTRSPHEWSLRYG